MGTIRIKAMRGFELKPGKKYIMTFDRAVVTREDVATAAKYLSDKGIDALFLGLRVPTDNSIQVVEIPDEKTL